MQLLRVSIRSWNYSRITQQTRQLPQLGRDRRQMTVGEVHQEWWRTFRNRKIGEPRESIANILAKVLRTRNLTAVRQERDTILSESQLREVEEMCRKRLQRMPIQYVIGEWDFHEITLRMRPPVFIPRPETEMLVDLALQDIRRRQIRCVLDLCCGSGAIALSLLNNVQKNLEVIAIDKCWQACRLCEENARNLNLHHRIKVVNVAVDSFDAEKQQFDLIVSNPPYILRQDMRWLQPEILEYEDRDALDGGHDGLDVIRQIFALAARFLHPHGRLLLEVDPSHPERLANAEDYGCELIYVGVHRDLSGVARFVEIMKR